MNNAAHDYSQYIDSLGLVLDDSSTLEAEDIAHLIEMANDWKSSAAWVLGDVANYARKHSNEDFINHLSHKVELRTLNNYSYIANRIPRERRRPNLSFSHHAAIAPLPEDEQEYWLNRAEKEELKRDELRQLIKDVAKVEKRTITANVGSIDKLLTLDMGLPLGFLVKVTYEVVMEAPQAAQERPAA